MKKGVNFMVECTTVINDKVQRQISKKLYISSIVCLVIGIIGVILYIVLSTIYQNSWADLLLLFAIPFGFGLTFFITLDTNYRILKNTAMVNFYIFDDDYLFVTTIKDNENVGSSQIPYNSITKIKENKLYLFIYINKVSALPVEKASLSEEDINYIKSKINTNQN